MTKLFAFLRKAFHNNTRMLRESCWISYGIFGGVATILQIVNYSLSDILGEASGGWFRFGISIVGFATISFAIILFKMHKTSNGFTLNIRGIDVHIIEGDIFEQNYWKIIPLNENFDTKVDDIIISKMSINGKFINRLSADKQELLKKAIEETDEKGSVVLDPLRTRKVARTIGRIVPFEGEYMILALTRVDEHHKAKLTCPEYTRCLLTMWEEISYIYADKPIALPLLGMGVTEFTDMPEKDALYFLKCILYTLRISNLNFNKAITIVLSKETIEKINLLQQQL